VTPLVDEALKRLGHIDILINNAGATWGAPAEDYPVDAWDKVMNLNIRSIFTVAGSRQMFHDSTQIRADYQRRFDCRSGGNAPGTMQTIAYNTSKAAVINFTRTLAGEWGAHGITVNAIAPGFSLPK
jgi:gluconate 5-dehydrogenase